VASNISQKGLVEIASGRKQNESYLNSQQNYGANDQFNAAT